MFEYAVERQLDGLRVLVAEDDHIQCDGIVACVAALGAIVVGPAHSLPEAHELVASKPVDLAIVDIDLGDGASFDLAKALQSRSLPFVFATAYDCHKVPREFEHIRCVEKPFTERALVSSLVETVHHARH